MNLNITMFSGYDMHTHKRTSGGMDFEMIYKDLEFQLWRDELCLELAQLKQDEFIIDLMKQLNGFSGWGDKERFQKIESKLQVLKGRIEEYIVELSPAIAEDKRIPEQMLIDKMTRALTKLQRNHNYNSSSSEDTMNDYVRDILDESYQIKDQTRQGESQKGDDAGEVDIQICVDGFPIVMIEALVLDSLKKQYLGDHINKVLTKYDPNGCPYAVIVIYATMARFDSFGEDGYEFASDIKTALSNAEEELTDITFKLEESMESLKMLTTDCDKSDYILAACSGAICGILDIFLVGKPGESPIGDVTDKWFENRTMDFASNSSPKDNT